MTEYMHNKHCSVLINVTLTVLKKVQSLSLDRLYGLVDKLLPTETVLFNGSEDYAVFLKAHEHYFKCENNKISRKLPAEEWPSENMEIQTVHLVIEELNKQKCIALLNVCGIIDKQFHSIGPYNLSKKETGAPAESRLVSLLVKYPQYFTLCGDFVVSAMVGDIFKLYTGLFETLIEQKGIVSSCGVNNGIVTIQHKDIPTNVQFDNNLLYSTSVSPAFIFGKAVIVDAVLSPATNSEWQATYIRLLNENPPNKQKIEVPKPEYCTSEKERKTIYSSTCDLKEGVIGAGETKGLEAVDSRYKDVTKTQDTNISNDESNTSTIIKTLKVQRNEAVFEINVSPLRNESPILNTPNDEIKYLRLQLEQMESKCRFLEDELRKYVNSGTCETVSVSTQTKSTGGIMSTKVYTST